MKLQKTLFTLGGKRICDSTVGALVYSLDVITAVCKNYGTFAMKYFCAAITITASIGASPSLATTIPYILNGTLDDGGRFMGTFTLSTEAIDRQPSSSLGIFDLENVKIRLVDTDLFMSGPSTATSGSATEASLIQRSSSQGLDFIFISDDRISNVFVDGLSFAPFNGDPNIAAPIRGDWTMGGFFDGAGNVDIVSVELAEIPEPSTMLLFGTGLAGLGLWRWKAGKHT